MPEQRLTFPTFAAGDSIRLIGAVGDVPGAYDQLATAFRTAEDSPEIPPRTLIKRVAPSSDFDRNVAHGAVVLGDGVVQQRLGYAVPTTADGVAYDIVNSTRLYQAVARPLMRSAGSDQMPKAYDYAVILEGKEGRVRGIARALAGLVRSGVQIGHVIGVSSGRAVTEGESVTYAAGTPSGEMMQGVLSEELDSVLGFGAVDMRHTDETAGKAVAQVAADLIVRQSGPSHLEDITVVVPAAPGTWVEKGAVTRRALIAAVSGSRQDGDRPPFDSDPGRPQLFVAARGVVLDETGRRTSDGRQRALTALGDVARSLMYASEFAV